MGRRSRHVWSVGCGLTATRCGAPWTGSRAWSCAGWPLLSSPVPRWPRPLAAAVAPVVLGLILLCTGQLAHYLLGRRRLAAWDAEWRATGPQWSRQR
jgi:hypothetical protein